ncbi:MAG TPA: tRNA (adenosine(37)-N6)-threonylcarbamoyltransferase complex ATPase subunit type 1 TsaE [Patescibacteria group bacterium]
MEITTIGSNETFAFGSKFAGEYEKRVICLFGNLGSGKTTFVAGFAKGLGIESRILSPSFVLVRSYPFVKWDKNFVFHHVDLFRLEVGQIDSIGLDDILDDPFAVVAIEWPEKIISRLPEDRHEIYFEVIDEFTRRIRTN